MRRCKAEVEQTRQRLLDAAERVFSDRGYAIARLEDIADVAGLTRGSIYWHYEGKPELLEAVIERAWFPWDQLPLERGGAQALPGIEEMATMLGDGVQRTLSVPHLRRSAAILLQGHELRHVSGRVQARLQGMQQRIRHYVAQVIEQACAGRLPGAERDAQARAVGVFMFGALSEALLLGLPGEQYPIGREVERFILALLAPATAGG
ncbi:TetR/AcrR family transcriptional regulator [Pantoea sp. Cy-639]|uniref:TetR/AcrR family transcriptional regulator n=1 Tax=Pantoea sp. Cy-639 TaxID=2608360 RepID=UPI00141F5394|nr:TetR/AcrR family transcriptional regulator [Pantoea sp. Cy-639]NIF19937.1 TetR family transcriptional regulator [Pantoea sp. Cy-639]